MFPVSRTNLIRQLRSVEKLLGLTAHLAPQRVMSPTEPQTTRANHQHATDQPRSADGAAVKPPNILIHHGDGGGGQGRLRQLVTSVVSGEHYTVYDLPVGAPPVWLESAALLVVAGQLTDAVTADAERFWRGGGAVLSLSSSLTLGCLSAEAEPVEGRDVLLSYGDEKDAPCSYSDVVRSLSTTSKSRDVNTDRSSDVTMEPTCDVSTPVTVLRKGCEPGNSPAPPPAVVRCSPTDGGGEASKSGVALLCQLDWDLTAPTQLRLLLALLRSELGVRCVAAAKEEVLYQPGHLVSDAATAARLMEDMPARHGPALRVMTGTGAASAVASADFLPLLIGPPPSAQFDWPLYRSELDTAALGRCLMHLPAVTSSMDVLRDLRLPHGAVVVCDRQTRGRGRAGNTWLSPVGCCMISIRLLVRLDSPLGNLLSWLQHALALAAVEAVGDPQLGLKWPNDLYWAGQTKVGGVLVETDITGRSAECRLGIGINLDNAAPTVCLNRVLATPMERERLTARLLSRLELLLSLEAAELGRRYMRHWLHERQSVTVQRDGVEVAAEVCGLDPHGFLLARAASDGAELAVSPDGNSFDMMRGLIVPKQAA